jgi:hypothetical protein
MSYGKDLPPAEDLPSGQLASRRLSAADAERLIVRHWAHPEAGAEQHRLAALLDSATAPPTDQELSGQAAAVAAFVLVTGDRAARSRRGASRRVMAITAGIVAASMAAGFSGAAAADALPGPIQELAHQTFGAPAPGPSVPGVKPEHTPGRPGYMSGATKGKGNKGTPPGLAKKAGGMPPGQAKKSGGTPPGQAKKAGGTPPGLAKKAGGMPPGQAKKGASSSPETATGSSSPQRSKLLFSGLTKQYEPRHASPAPWPWSSGLSAKTSRNRPSQPGPQRA